MASASTARALFLKADATPEIESLANRIIGAAIEVHRELGPGLLEKVYEDALVHELSLCNVGVERQVEVPIAYKGVEIRGQRLDLLVGGLVIVEIKSLSHILDVHGAQLLSYLRAARLPVGLLLNFNVPMLKQGIKRVFNERVSPPFVPLPSGASRTSR